MLAYICLGLTDRAIAGRLYLTEKAIQARLKSVYAKFGIPAYWIVTPSVDKPSLTVLELREGSYVEQALVSGDEVYRAERPFAVEICPANLVALRRPG